jgi:hypothetical protein
MGRINRKGDLITPNTVLAILFLILTIVVISILAQWWKAYNSSGTLPGERSLDILQKSINLLAPGDSRVVPIQTNLYSIRSFNDEKCTMQDDKPLNCICLCDDENCDISLKDNNRYCRIIKYKSDISLEKIEQVKNYKISLEGTDEDMSVTIVQNG